MSIHTETPTNMTWHTGFAVQSFKKRTILAPGPDAPIRVEFEENAWLRWRQKGVTGTDVAAINNLSPWKTEIQVYLEKTLPYYEAKNLVEKTERMEWGTRLEPAIIDHALHLLRQEYSVATVDRGLHVESSRRNELRGSLDALAYIETGDALAPIVIEAKNLSWSSFDDWKRYGNQLVPPTHYWHQIAHYMQIVQAEKGYFALLVGGHHFELVEVDLDPRLGKIPETLTALSWYSKYITDKAKFEIADRDFLKYTANPNAELAYYFDKIAGREAPSEPEQHQFIPDTSLCCQFKRLRKKKNALNKQLQILRQIVIAKTQINSGKMKMHDANCEWRKHDMKPCTITLRTNRTKADKLFYTMGVR